MKVIITAALIIVCFAISGRVVAAEINAPTLEADITREGAGVVVKRLVAGSGQTWQRVLSHIKSGQNDWLTVARMIQPGVDAATGEDLIAAVATALKKNPSSVLTLTGAEFPIEKVCDVPLIEPTDAQVKRWKSDVLMALSHVQDPTLSTQVKACRVAIAAVK